MPLVLPRLCAIVDAEVAARAGFDPVTLAEAYLRGGATWLQLRAKRAGSRDLLAWAEAIAARTRDAGALLVVNDRADVARLVGAGVHVGQDDLPAAHARSLVGDASIVGLSTHSLAQFERGLAEPVSYLAVGPVFGTTTKATGYEPVGVALVSDAARRSRGQTPVVAIGGITLERAPEVIAAGASAVAVIGDLVTGDPAARTRAWVMRLRDGGVD